jgi:hypothetical protein
MTTEPHPLRARPRASTAVVPASADHGAAELEVRIRHATQVAAARDALPSNYRQNPGAIMLAQEWAQTRGLDLLTTLQTVSFVNGRPVIDATMQRALAKRAGYEVHVEVAEDGQSATCALHHPGSKVHSATCGMCGQPAVGAVTYTLEDARTANLLGKDNWQQNPKAMLVARATAFAMRWHAPDVMVGVFAPEELEDGTALDALQEQLARVQEPAGTDGDEPVDAEVVEDGAPAEPAQDLGAAEPLAQGQQPGDEPCSDETWQQLSDKLRSIDTADREQLATWASSRGWRLEQRRLTEAAALSLLAWEPR